MLEIDETRSLAIQMTLLKVLFEGATTQEEEEERLTALVSRVYGDAGKRLAKSLSKTGQLRRGVSQVMVHGFILRRHETAEFALTPLLTKNSDGSAAILCPERLLGFITRILTEGPVKNKEKNLFAILPPGMLDKKQAFTKVREGRKEKEPRPLRLRTTRTQAQIDTALAGSGWEGAIVAADAEFIPPGFIRLQVLIVKGVKDYSLSNSLANVLGKAGVEQIFIKKGYYREDLLLACAQVLREPARSGLISAIKSESSALLEASFD